MSTVVIGLGNVVLGDDGAGVHAVRRLRARWALPDDVEVVEGGTAGLLLLPWLDDSERAILVDAVDVGEPPGTIRRLEGPALARPFPRRLSPHDVGVADLLGAATLSDALPATAVLLGVQAESTALGTELGVAVSAALDPLVDAIAAQLADWGHTVGRMPVTLAG
jgi:hydrogenase maturation protease